MIVVAAVVIDVLVVCCCWRVIANHRRAQARSSRELVGVAATAGTESAAAGRRADPSPATSHQPQPEQAWTDGPALVAGEATLFDIESVDPDTETELGRRAENEAVAGPETETETGPPAELGGVPEPAEPAEPESVPPPAYSPSPAVAEALLARLAALQDSPGDWVARQLVPDEPPPPPPPEDRDEGPA